MQSREQSLWIFIIYHWIALLHEFFIFLCMLLAYYIPGFWRTVMQIINSKQMISIPAPAFGRKKHANLNPGGSYSRDLSIRGFKGLKEWIFTFEINNQLFSNKKSNTFWNIVKLNVLRLIWILNFFLKKYLK